MRPVDIDHIEHLAETFFFFFILYAVRQGDSNRELQTCPKMLLTKSWLSCGRV